MDSAKAFPVPKDTVSIPLLEALAYAFQCQAADWACSLFRSEALKFGRHLPDFLRKTALIIRIEGFKLED